MTKKIAILASGGNSSAMNNAIITLVRKAKMYGIEVELIYDGYKGLLEKKFVKPDLQVLYYFNNKGNVIIGSARSTKFRDPEYKKQAAEFLKERGIDTLFVIGGDGSYQGAYLLSKFGVRVICLPGTIDNDIRSTEESIGFSTTLNTIVTSIDALRDSFDSHSGVCIVEVMGRRYPDLAIYAGIATDSELIITCENVMTSEQILEVVNRSWENKHRCCMIVVTEQIYGKDGLPTLKDIAKEIEEKTGRTTRVCVLGHTQRGGVPTAEDRYIANTLASYALDVAVNESGNYAIGIKLGKPHAEPIDNALAIDAKKPNTEILKKYFKYNCF